VVELSDQPDEQQQFEDRDAEQEHPRGSPDRGRDPIGNSDPA
jgi:hypothetical protein